MWNTKYFKTYEKAIKFINDNWHKYQSELIIINNGYGVEYRKLIKM